MQGTMACSKGGVGRRLKFRLHIYFSYMLSLACSSFIMFVNGEFREPRR